LERVADPIDAIVRRSRRRRHRVFAELLLVEKVHAERASLAVA
jgi:hypothetical protein